MLKRIGKVVFYTLVITASLIVIYMGIVIVSFAHYVGSH